MKLTILMALLLTGCASTQQPTTSGPLYKYRANMQITVDGKAFDGMAVTALGEKDISIVSQAALNLLRITTCHRDFSVEKVDKGWFGGASKTFTYHYKPTLEESQGVCPMYIQAVSKDLVTDWGYLYFRTDETLPAQMDCNGTSWSFSGTSVCQTKAGLDQAIRFDHAVKYEADAACKITAVSDKEFKIRGSLGFCYAEFSDGKAWHRMILLGYDTVLVRGD